MLQEVGAKPQEGLKTATFGLDQPIHLGKVPTGPMFSANAPVLGHVEEGNQVVPESSPVVGGGVQSDHVEGAALSSSADGGLAGLTAQISKFVGALSEEKASSTIKWNRKQPVIKAQDAESLMTEIVELENVYSDMQCKTWKKKWSVFRPALQGKAKDKVDLEL